jgi:hypothetical protein
MTNVATKDLKFAAQQTLSLPPKRKKLEGNGMKKDTMA